MTSWIKIPENSDFPLENIPFGIAKVNEIISPSTRIGDTMILLSVMADYGYFDELNLDDLSIFYQPVLNEIVALNRQQRIRLRERLTVLFSDSCDDLKQNAEACSTALYNMNEVEMLLPIYIGDYTDFYSSIEHATNVGVMFRDPANALLPNWRYLPVGYHGRSSSIVVSGTNIHRPKGQTRPDEKLAPVFGPSKQVDFELEMGFITSGSTKLGDSISANDAENHIVGMVLFNDLSARDLQRWEYVPLGPFLSKSFGSVISPWIITLEALEPFRVEGPKQEPAVFPYLQTSGKRNIDITLEVYLKPQQGEENLLCRSNFRYMYWNMAQQLAHQTVAGCNINPGDLYASGTISGPTPDSFGSMLELAWKGTKPLPLKDGTQRTFVLDNDTLIIRGFAQKDGLRIGFGECMTKILPST